MIHYKFSDGSCFDDLHKLIGDTLPSRELLVCQKFENADNFNTWLGDLNKDLKDKESKYQAIKEKSKIVNTCQSGAVVLKSSEKEIRVTIKLDSEIIVECSEI